MKTLAIFVLLMALVSPALAQSPIIVSPDGRYLGNLNANPYDPNSVANPYGHYGSPYSHDSINNPYGPYGSPYSPRSAHNPYAPNPPMVITPEVQPFVQPLLPPR